MSPELDAALVRDFPRLYRDRHASMQVTAMCWGFPGDGWEPLIRELSEVLEPLGAVAAQVKEKYGTLRYYFDFAEDVPTEARELADLAVVSAELLSAQTCEACGQPGEVKQVGGWYRAACPAHEQRNADAWGGEGGGDALP